MPGCFVRTLPFFAPRDAMLIMLVCATHWLSMHLYTLAYMFMHESCLLVCHLCFNTIKLWTFDPNLHLSLADTTFCLPCCLFVFFLVSLRACSPSYLLVRLFIFSCHVSHHMLWLPYLSCLFALHPLPLFTHLFLSIACLLVSCLCLCMYTHGARTHGARAQFPRCK